MPKNVTKTKVLIASSKDFLDRIYFSLEEDFVIVHLDLNNNPLNLMKSYNIDCVVAYIEKRDKELIEKLATFKNGYPNKPILAVIEDQNIELARKCGEIGINKVTSYYRFDINKSVPDLIKEFPEIEKIEPVTEIKNIPVLVKQAICIIKNNYTKLKQINEVAEILQISQCTLTREFKKLEFMSPKKLLLLYKLNHVLCLMRNINYTLIEIIKHAGFDNANCFYTCFKEIFNNTPKQVMEKIQHQNLFDEYQTFLLNYFSAYIKK